MQLDGPAKRLDIFIDETDQYEDVPLYAALVEVARRQGLAGATVTRGIMGFGAHSVIHTASILRLSEDLPVVVTVVDAADRIEAFLAVVGDMVREGAVVTSDVQVHLYRSER